MVHKSVQDNAKNSQEKHEKILEISKDIDELKKKEQFKEIPIIFCSSNVMKGDRETALQAGASGYIEKPIIPEEFIAEIKKYFQ